VIKLPARKHEEHTATQGIVYRVTDADDVPITWFFDEQDADQIVTALNTQGVEPSEFVKRMQWLLKDIELGYQPEGMLEIKKEDWQQALAIITRLEAEKKKGKARIEKLENMIRSWGGVFTAIDAEQALREED
jgi:hypothetical protein